MVNRSHEFRQSSLQQGDIDLTRPLEPSRSFTSMDVLAKAPEVY
jgi:hypothetical protein